MAQKYQADGTVSVRFGGTRGKVVTFTPAQHIEQGGSKFVVFVPSLDGGKQPRKGLVVKAKEAELNVDDADELYGPLLEAAVHHIKVTVFVLYKHGRLSLEEVVLPSHSAKPSAE